MELYGHCHPISLPNLRIAFRVILDLTIVLLLAIPMTCNAAEPNGMDDSVTSLQRVSAGLQVLYDFRAVEAGKVADKSGKGKPLNLTIHVSKNAKSTLSGLNIQGKASITSGQSASDLSVLLRKANALSIEIWMRPKSLTQSGPARLLTLSKSGNERNFTLGQEGDKLDFRLRTTATSTNGIPSLMTKNGVVQDKQMHVVCTFGPSGMSRVFADGVQVAEQPLQGDFSNWSDDYQLAIANELSGDRPWEGNISMVAIFSRELSESEVRRNFEAGLPVNHSVTQLNKADLNAAFFERNVAPILARHCLECHDTSTKQGGLDLSRSKTTLVGGDSGAVLVAGDSAKSRIWKSVESDKMPHDRTPLMTNEKKLLKKWIDDGADWRLAVIDPANYVHGTGSQTTFVQRLTVPEYVESIKSLLGIDVTEQAVKTLPRDLRADGFSNTAYNLTVDLAHIEAYMEVAEYVVGKIDVDKLAKRSTKSREMSDENIVKFVDSFGRLALRGPLSERERQSYLGVSTSVAAAGGGFDEVIRYIVAAMLQSPRFIYRIENQRGDGTSWPVAPYELASRLSYILWGGPPDEALLKAAEKNELSGAILKEQVDRMLKDERAVRRSHQFITEWLNLGHLKNLQPDANRFPTWKAELAEDMQAETLAYFEEIVWKQNRPVADLLNAQLTFVTSRLAEHYKLPAKILGELKSEAGQLIKIDLSSVPERGGLLTQGSTLTIGGDDASTVTRGLFVMHELLRGVVKDPPPCVDATPVPSKPGLTQRTVAEQRMANQSCVGCHAKFEPLSFGLEKFNGVGAYNERDEFGNELREDGAILFPGEAQNVEYKKSADLLKLLSESDRVKETITWKMTQFALGRPLGAEDAGMMAEIHKASQSAGGRWTDIMKAIVLSDLVQLNRTLPDSL